MLFSLSEFLAQLILSNIEVREGYALFLIGRNAYFKLLDLGSRDGLYRPGAFHSPGVY